MALRSATATRAADRLCVAKFSREFTVAFNDGGSVMKAEQVSVPLPAELREYVARRAAVEDRSVASVIRRLVAEAAQAETTSDRGGKADALQF
jgi:hypothetical protein